MSRSEGREIYRVVWPRGARTVQATDVAPRLSTLEGKTIGQLWDDLFRGDEIFPILEEELARRFPGIRFVRYDAFGSTHGRDEQQPCDDDHRPWHRLEVGDAEEIDGEVVADGDPGQPPQSCDGAKRQGEPELSDLRLGGSRPHLPVGA